MRTSPSSTVLALLPLMLVAAADRAAAQCGFAFAPANAGDPLSAPRGSVQASTYWDPDGAGPLPNCLVVGGMFAVADARQCAVAYYDGTAWTPLGVFAETAAIEDVPCVALAVHNGQLVAATGTRVYLRSGASWQAIGQTSTNPLVREVRALSSFQGSLFVGGAFAAMAAPGGSSPVAGGLARWNGASWSSVGAVTTANALAVVGNRLYVGGSFLAAGGVAARNLAAWDGASWAAVGDPNGVVFSLGARTSISTSTTFLFVGGGFTQIGGVAATGVARNAVSVVGTAWQPMSGLPTPVVQLGVRGIGTTGFECLAAVGNTLYRWNGAGWDTQFAIAAGDVGAVNTFGGVAFAGAQRSVQTPHGMSHALVRADGTTLYGQGIAGRVLAVADWNGQRVIAGDFQRVGGVVVNGIAIGDAGAWQPLGNGLTGGVGKVRALLPIGGLLYAAGEFTAATGGVADGIAVWNGAAWQPVGAGLDGPVHALAIGTNGTIYAGGSFTASGATAIRGLARYGLTGWQTVLGGLDGNATSAVVTHLAMVGTDLYVGGTFATAGPQNTVVNNLARVDVSPLAQPTTAWQALTRAGASAPGVGAVRALAATDEGVLVAHQDALPSPFWTNISKIAGATFAEHAPTPNTYVRATDVEAIVGAPSRTFLVLRGYFELKMLG